jgi:hypothetical protein
MARIVSLGLVIFLLPLLIRVVQDEIFGVSYPLLRAICEKIDSTRCLCRGPYELVVCLWHMVQKCFSLLFGRWLPVSLKRVSKRRLTSGMIYAQETNWVVLSSLDMETWRRQNPDDGRDSQIIQVTRSTWSGSRCIDIRRVRDIRILWYIQLKI